jgi:hypothetical protein
MVKLVLISLSLIMANWLSDERDDETRRYKGSLVDMLTEMTSNERIVNLITAS